LLVGLAFLHIPYSSRPCSLLHSCSPQSPCHRCWCQFHQGIYYSCCRPFRLQFQCSSAWHGAQKAGWGGANPWRADENRAASSGTCTSIQGTHSRISLSSELTPRVYLFISTLQKLAWVIPAVELYLFTQRGTTDGWHFTPRMLIGALLGVYSIYIRSV